MDRIFELIKVWAGVSTWYTSHPLDHRRFNEAVRIVFNELGPNVSEADFEAALRQHAERHPGSIDGGPREEDIQHYTQRAMQILSFLSDERANFK